MPDLARRWWPLLFVVLAALWLRTHELDQRPMHWDEANQAVKAGELVEKGRYAFDPADHHGPTLYYAVLPFAWIRGERTLPELSETTVRLVPAIFGTIGVILVAILATGPGRRRNRVDDGAARATNERKPGVAWAAIAAAAFVACSPPAVYYSRYFVQETLLVTFLLGALVSGRQWWRTGRPGWAIALGGCVGLMQATKASTPLFLVAALIAAAVTVWFHRGGRGAATAGDNGGVARSWGRDGALVLGSALLVAALFYSSFGSNPRGLLDAARAYGFAGQKVGGGGHEKPWWYYLQLFGWMRRGGLVWHQLAFSALALGGLGIGVASILRRRINSANTAATGDAAAEPRRADRRGTLAIWAGAYTVIVMGALSAIAYKTPWHAIHFVPGMALLGACALRAVSRLNTGKFVGVAFAIVTIGTLYQQTARTSFQWASEERNPYAYVHSSKDVLKIRAIAESALLQMPGQPIHVVSEEYWPLPWYLRGFGNVGYWSEIPANVDGALVVASQSTAEAVAARLRGNYRQSFLGLRPGFVCILFIREP